MSVPAQKISITYGGTTVGGTSGTYITDKVKIDRGQDTVTVTASVVVVGTLDSGFKTACTALETAFSTPRQDLSLTYSGSQAHETFSHSGNTGFNATPTIRKVGWEGDTGLTRKYEISVTVILPADLYGTSDRRDSSVTLTTLDSGRRRCTITGTYTATAGVASRAQYLASFTTYVATILTSFGGTWEGPLDRQESTDDQDKICNFSIAYEELIYNQSSGVLDDATLVRPRLDVTTSIETPGDSVFFGLPTIRMQTIAMQYTTAVAKSVTQDLKGTWETKIRPFLLSVAATVASSSNLMIVSETPSFEPYENRITASLIVMATGNSKYLRCQIATDDSEDMGITLVPVWHHDRMMKVPFRGPGSIRRTVTIVTRELADPGSPPPTGPASLSDVIGGVKPGGPEDISEVSSGGNDNLALAGGVAEAGTSPDGRPMSRVVLGVSRSSHPSRIGPARGPFVNIVDRTVVVRYEYFVDYLKNRG